MEPQKIPCNLCEKSFTDRSNMYRHKRKCHQVESQMELWRKSRIRCLEEDCGFATDTTEKLSAHLTEKHGIEITVVERKFESFEGTI